MYGRFVMGALLKALESTAEGSAEDRRCQVKEMNSESAGLEALELPGQLEGRRRMSSGVGTT